ncbi:MAG: hypothetical protein H7Y43_10650 [Akkermansiaceae bacterium]|nr:hypothetical protein [Verrucomicrobiales bacterium]
MKPRFALALMLMLAIVSVAQAQVQVPRNARMARSVSGAFLVHPSKPAFTSRFHRGDDSSISLEPAVLAISCERIKQSLWRILDSKAPAKGKIHVHLRPARFAFEQATIVVEPGISGWDYRIDVPDSLPPVGFVGAIVHASLLEIANRNAGEKSAEIPLWLAEGLAQELLMTEKIEFLLPPAQTQDNGLLVNRLLHNQRRTDSLEHARRILRVHAPLTFEQLSWPTQGQLSGDGLDVFRGSAQLFVRQLLDLQQGQGCLRETLNQLPRTFNWQFALLRGFSTHFKSQLDIEKWWALQLVQFTGRDLMRAYTPEVSWTKLEEILLSPAESRSNPLELPRRTEITLQTMIQDWDAFSQRTALLRKSRELEMLRSVAAQEVIVLVDDYRDVLGRYLRKQNFSGGLFGLKKQVGPIRNRLADETIRELNLLDAKRVDSRTAPVKTVAGMQNDSGK